MKGLHEYSVSWVFGQSNQMLRSELVDFWGRNGAIQDPREAWRRSFEVACTARNAVGKIVGVSSVYHGFLSTGAEPYWFYRTYIQPDSRVFGLLHRLFHETYDRLGAISAEAHAPTGIVVIPENEKFLSAAGKRVLLSLGLGYGTSSHQGKPVWIKRFEGIKA